MPSLTLAPQCSAFTSLLHLHLLSDTLTPTVLDALLYSGSALIMLTQLEKLYRIGIILFHCAAINIGFEQERYTVFEADAIGDLIRIPIVKENDQESELTFEVIGSPILGSGFTAARLDPPGQDFIAIPQVQDQDFNPDEQEIEYLFELIDDSVPEPTETFQIQLSLGDEGLTNINLAASGGSLFATATVVIIDDDG